jgi:hypothetical protein
MGVPDENMPISIARYNPDVLDELLVTKHGWIASPERKINYPWTLVNYYKNKKKLRDMQVQDMMKREARMARMTPEERAHENFLLSKFGPAAMRFASGELTEADMTINNAQPLFDAAQTTSIDDDGIDEALLTQSNMFARGLAHAAGKVSDGHALRRVSFQEMLAAARARAAGPDVREEGPAAPAPAEGPAAGPPGPQPPHPQQHRGPPMTSSRHCPTPPPSPFIFSGGTPITVPDSPGAQSEGGSTTSAAAAARPLRRTMDPMSASVSTPTTTTSESGEVGGDSPPTNGELSMEVREELEMLLDELHNKDADLTGEPARDSVVERAQREAEKRVEAAALRRRTDATNVDALASSLMTARLLSDLGLE